LFFRQAQLNHEQRRSRVTLSMIVCSCSLITDSEVAEAVTAIRTADPLAVIKPGRIYRRLGKRPSCAGCLSLVRELIVFYDQECRQAPEAQAA
jgi:bacterioferritin-associated ferredoxin